MGRNECSVIHVTTTCEGGAGLAATRLHLALLGIGFPSLILTRHRSLDQLAVHNLFTVRPSPSKRVLSKATTLVDRAIDKGDFSLFTPFSTTTLQGLAATLDSSTVVNIHNGFNFIDWETVAELRRRRIPVVFTLHDERWFTGGCHHSQQCTGFLDMCRKCPRAPDLLQWAPERNVRNAIDVLSEGTVSVVSPSRWLAKRAQLSAVFRGHRVDVIPNPLPSDYTADDVGVPYHRDVGKGGVLWVAWLPGKGDDLFQEVVDILQRTSDREPPIGVVTTTASSLFTTSLPMRRVSPPITETQRRMFWSSADVAALTTEGDNFPNVVIESLSVGTPMLVPAIGGAFEAVQDTGGGLVLDRSAEAFAQALLRLARDPSLVHLMAQAAHHRSWKLYSPDGIAERYVAVYDTALRGG